MLKKLFPFFKSGDAYAYQGMRQYSVGNYLQAIENYYKALDRKLKIYDDYEIYAKIGYCYWQLYLFDKSIDAYKKSIEINPNYHKSWSELGVFHRKNGNFKEAVRCYEEAIRINPDYPDIHTNLGANYIYLNEPEKAVETLKRAIELDPSFYASYSNMALALAMLGKYDEAEKTAKRAVTLGSKKGKELQAIIRDLRDMDDPGFDANNWIIWNN